MISFFSNLLSSYPSSLAVLFSGLSDTSTNLCLFTSTASVISFLIFFVVSLLSDNMSQHELLLLQLAPDGRDWVLPSLEFLCLVFTIMSFTVILDWFTYCHWSCYHLEINENLLLYLLNQEAARISRWC